MAAARQTAGQPGHVGEERVAADRAAGMVEQHGGGWPVHEGKDGHAYRVRWASTWADSVRSEAKMRWLRSSSERSSKP